MSSVRIVADSGCDIPPSVAKQYDITIIPCYVRFGQETLSDADLSMAEFWARADQSSQSPGTAAPPPSVFQQAFERLISAGHEVICLTLPSKHSAIFNSAWLAAQEFGQRVRVIDSRSITLGMGYQTLVAAKAALEGHSLDRIQRTVESVRDRTSVIFVLDTLEWVRQGGRMDRLMPVIERLARTFHVKPIVEMVDGDLHLLGVARSYRSALARLEEEVRARLPVETVAAAYTRSREAAGDLTARLARVAGIAPADIVLQEAGPVFASHAGPNALGTLIVRS